MRPNCIVMDEPTAMLDPMGRQEVLETIKGLNKNYGMTIVLITHHMDEAAQADRLIVMQKGTVVQDGPPKEVFAQVEALKGSRPHGSRHRGALLAAASNRRRSPSGCPHRRRVRRRALSTAEKD